MYQYEINEIFNVKSLISYSNNFSNVRGDFSNQNFDLNISSENRAAKVYLGADLPQHYLELGVEFNQIKLNPGTITPSNSKSIIESKILELDHGREWGFLRKIISKLVVLN